MQRLTGLDATFLYLETSHNHMHVAATAIFEPDRRGPSAPLVETWVIPTGLTPLLGSGHA